MKIANNHIRQGRTLRVVPINGVTYHIHNGDFTTSKIVVAAIKKMQRGTIKLDATKQHVIVSGGVFEPVTVRQF